MERNIFWMSDAAITTPTPIYYCIEFVQPFLSWSLGGYFCAKHHDYAGDDDHANNNFPAHTPHLLSEFLLRKCQPSFNLREEL